MLALVPVDDSRQAFLAALLARDSGRARATIAAALAEGVPPADVYLDILGPVLREVGHRWAMGTLNVAEEHYATAIVQSLLESLGMRLGRPPKDGRLAIVSGTPHELHALGSRVVSDFLESDGWEVLHLGPGVPAADLAALAGQEQPDLVALSTATAAGLDGVAEVLAVLGGLRPRPLLVVGGQFWTAETSQAAPGLGADLVIQDPRRLVAVLRERIPPPEG